MAQLDLVLARDHRDDRGNTRLLEEAVRRAELVRIRRGVYVNAAAWANADGRERHLAIVSGARASAFTEPVFSHESAAALHGIPLLRKWPTRASTTVSRGGSASSRAVSRAIRTLRDRDVMSLADGTLVTTPARTAIDLAARGSALEGIVAFSHVRFGGTSDLEIEEALDAARGTTGAGAARRGFDRSTVGSESPLETLVMVRCADLGFALPTQQQRVTVDGVPYRVDFSWLGGEVLGEADGRIKYVAANAGGRSLEEVVWAEKRREDALRRVCEAFVRIAWEDAWDGRGLESRLLSAGVPRRRRRRTGLTF